MPLKGKENRPPPVSRSVSRNRIWCGLSSETKDKIKTLALDIRQSGLVVDKKHRLTTHKSVIVGKDVVSWMVQSGRVASREEGKALGQMLLVGDYIHHVTDDYEFEDKRCYYRFRSDEKMSKGPSAVSLVKGARMEGWLAMRKGKSSLRMKRHYCVMSEGKFPVLYYFKDDIASNPSGFINFQKTSYRVRYIGSSPGKHAFQLNAIAPGGRKVRIIAVAPNANQLQGWISAFVAAGAEFVENVSMDASSIYEYSVFNAENKPVCFDRYRGQVLLIVNMPAVVEDSDRVIEEFSRLQALDEEYKDMGLRVIGFPCSHFENVEAGKTADGSRLREELDLQFDVMSKVCINGINRHPLFAFLKARMMGKNGTFIGEEFVKFLITKSGSAYRRYEPSEDPFATLEADIQKLLTKGKSIQKPAAKAVPKLEKKSYLLTSGSPIRLPKKMDTPAKEKRYGETLDLASPNHLLSESVVDVFSKPSTPGSAHMAVLPLGLNTSVQNEANRKRRSVESPSCDPSLIPSSSYFSSTSPAMARPPPSYDFTVQNGRRSSLPMTSSPDYNSTILLSQQLLSKTHDFANMSMDFRSAAPDLDMSHDQSFAEDSFVEAVDCDQTQLWDHNLSCQFGAASFIQSPQASKGARGHELSPPVRSPVISESSSPRQYLNRTLSNPSRVHLTGPNLSQHGTPLMIKDTLNASHVLLGTPGLNESTSSRSFMRSGSSVRTTFV